MTRIRTSHVGSLPRPHDLISLNRQALDGEAFDESKFEEELAQATDEVVARQVATGIDLPNDGEYGHAMGSAVDYAAWWSYIFQRLGGLAMSDGTSAVPTAPRKDGGIRLSTFPERRERAQFAAAYADPDWGVAIRARSAVGKGRETRINVPVCEGPLTYAGHDEVARDTKNLLAAIDHAGGKQAFMCSIGPGSLARIGNSYYETDEEFVWACAEAMREEYLAITNAGLTVQIDEPSFADCWDQFNPEPTLDEYVAFTMVRVEALNHALRGIPQEQVRFHCCWGSWHGPHVTDIEIKHLTDPLLRINAGSYSFEAANARHEHEWRVWETVNIPDDRTLVPGVVCHATNVVEHPQLVADRLERFARIVGPDRVIGSTDCGLGGRIHPDIAWAKLESLVAGARLAEGRI